MCCKKLTTLSFHNPDMHYRHLDILMTKSPQQLLAIGIVGTFFNSILMSFMVDEFHNSMEIISGEYVHTVSVIFAM